MTAPTDLMRPLPDQQVAIDYFRGKAAVLCGDSMGVGKTVTAIGRDFQIREDDPLVDGRPTLIICEKIGLDVWDYHLQAMGVPKEKIIVIDPRNRGEFVESLRVVMDRRRKFVGTHPQYLYFVCHWDVLVRVDEFSEKYPNGSSKLQFAHVIADEVHLAKNRKALRTIELKKIATRYKTGLSGTPADDKPQDLWSILHWLYPKEFRGYWPFINKYVEYSTEPPRGNKPGYRKLMGPKNVDDLHRRIRPFYIRRTLRDVAPDMPEKFLVQPPIVVRMGARQRREYESMRDKAIAKIGAMAADGRGSFTLLAPAIIAVLTRLQQMALATLAPEWEIDDSEYGDEEGFDDDWDMPKIVLAKPSPKLDAVMNLIDTHEEEPFVVFTQFRGMADLVEEECIRMKIPVVKIHGGMTDKNKRTAAVKAFQDGEARVFVGTIAAAGKTITLTRANHVIFTDRSWNPSKNEQAEDRLWRRTQRNAVRVYDIIAEDSIDEWRMKRIQQKADWINDFLNPTGRRQRYSNEEQNALVAGAINDVLAMAGML
jgi:SNF2 family DNA or RNA helicase